MDEPENGPDYASVRTTMFKEMVATFFGVAPYVIAIVIWGSTVNERLRAVEVRADIAAAEQERAERVSREQRNELVTRLEKIAAQIETLQQSVARMR